MPETGTAGRGSAVVIGIGNELRGDDGAGVEVARRVAAATVARPGVDVRVEQGELLRVLETWQGYDTALLVDAVSAGLAAGEVRRMNVSTERLDPTLAQSASTHAVSLSDTIELARSLRCLPPTVIVYGVQGGDFTLGTGLSAPVQRAVEAVTRAVLGELPSDRRWRPRMCAPDGGQTMRGMPVEAVSE